LAPQDFFGPSLPSEAGNESTRYVQGPALSGPASFFENVLDVDQFTGVFGDVEANRVGCAAARKLVASMASESDIAHFAHACFIGLDGAARRTALACESVT
jgi:hypothetical protein